MSTTRPSLDPALEVGPAAPVVHPRALPNRLTPEQLRLRPAEDGTVEVDPQRAGWRYLHFRTVILAGGAWLEIPASELECALLVLSGGGLRVEPTDRPTLELAGRASVFDGLPWAAYLPAGQAARVTAEPSSGGHVTVALAQAPSSGRGGSAAAAGDVRPVAIGPADVEVEVRGAGNATRQITHIIAPSFPADRLLMVEVHTPSGNWSSWPPHKHDTDAMPGEAVLEEIYHYQLRRPEGWGVQRLYRRDGSRDALWAVRHGELVLVTDGYHPFVAAHGYDAYYLNVLAGDRRTMACSDDPDLAWSRAVWETMERDPRVPMVPPRQSPRSG